MNATKFKHLATDPAAFRAELVFPSAHGPARFGDVLAPFQARDFAALDPALLALAAGQKPDIGRFWWERTKGASKDTDLAVALLWLLAFSPRPLACQVGAADQDQADELRKAARGILRLNPWLSQVLDVQSWSIVNDRTDSVCEIIAADVAGSHGARPDLLVINELSHIGKQEFAENLLDNASKVPHGLVCIATNAGFTDSWQWPLRELARTSPRWYWSAHTEPAPWLDPAEIEEARRRNSPARFARLWRGQWVRGMGDALTSEDIDAAVNQTGPMYGNDRGWVMYAGLDLGISRDHAARCVICLRDGRLRLASIRSWAPPPGGKIDLTAVEDDMVETHRRYDFHAGLFDTWQAELMGQRLRAQGVPMVGVPFTVLTLQQMASVILERFTSRSIDLFDDEGLRRDLHALKLLDRGTSFRLDAPRNKSGHGDRGTAFCLSVLAAERYPAVWCEDDSEEITILRA